MKLHLDNQLTVCSGLGVWLQVRVPGKFPQARLLTSFVLFFFVLSFKSPRWNLFHLSLLAIKPMWC